MDTARFFGIIAVFGVLAIWGGGLMYHWFHSYGPVWVYVVVLAIVAVNVGLKVTVGKQSAASKH